MMLPDKDTGCHRTGFEKDCRALVTDGRCKRWVQIQGQHPQTGEQISRWDCVDNLMPMLTLETTLASRQTGAAVESFRNEMVVANGIVAIQQQIRAAASGQTPAIGRRDQFAIEHQGEAKEDEREQRD